MNNFKLNIAAIALILANFLLMALPAFAFFLVKKEVDIYATRTLLTERLYIFIVAVWFVAGASFMKLGGRSFKPRTRLISVLEAIVGTYLYISLYDDLLTY